MRRMTRARNAAKGLVTPPPLHRWMEAVLLPCVSLVQGAATTFRMILNRRSRDWHTGDAQEALPQATSVISSQGTHSGVTSPFRMEADLSVRVPREGGGPDLREAQTHDRRSAQTRPA